MAGSSSSPLRRPPLRLWAAGPAQSLMLLLLQQGEQAQGWGLQAGFWLRGQGQTWTVCCPLPPALGTMTMHGGTQSFSPG